MKRLSFKILSSLAVVAFLTSCGGINKMKEGAEDVQYTVTPEVLEVNGGKVDMTVNVNVPEKFMDKNATMELTPVLVYEGGETAFAPKTVQGENVDGNNQTIPYTSGGLYTYTGSVDYNDGMRVSDLVVRVTASKKNKSVVFDDYKIADGVISTSQMVDYDQTGVAIGDDKFQRITDQNQEAYVYFLIQQAALRGTELRKEEISELKKFVEASKAAENVNFKGVEISAYASPDGATDLNTRLAERRQKVSTDYIKRELKKAKVDASDDHFVTSRSTPEDWEGFKDLMEKSNIQDKDLILRVLSMHSDPETREAEIKNMAATYKVIAEEILPQLRRARMDVNVEVIGKSDSEISSLASSNPSELNAEELLYAATLTNDQDRQLSIYQSATRVHSNDWRGYNNVACILIDRKEFDAAEAQLDKAANLQANNPVVQNNYGAIALIQGDYDAAKEYFGNAAGAGEELNENLGILAIYNGDYDAAVANFGNSTSNNAALAKILAGKYDAALSTLNANTEETGMKYYLKAIVGARTSDSSLCFDSLSKSVKLDSKYKGLASTDMEFGKYLEDSKFKSIVE